MVESMESVGASNPFVGGNKQNLETKLQEVKDKQGVVGKVWNEVKEVTGLGKTEKSCETMLEKYEKGEISFEEAAAYIEEFDKKQENSVELISNIATGVSAIALATTAAATCGASAIGVGLAAAKGAPIGALVKTGVKALDRATNDIEGDALDTKQLAKDAISGAVGGTVSPISSGMSAGFEAAKIGLTVAKGAQCSLACGAGAGAIGYLADVALDEDKEFNFFELATNTATSAAISGVVGGAVGAGLYGIKSAAGEIGKQIVPSTSRTIVQDSLTSATNKVLNSDLKEIIAA